MELMDRIRALLNQASNTPYEGEAATFFNKAQELMEKYAISEEALWAGTHGSREKPIVETMLIKGDGAYDKFTLITFIGKYNRCIVWKEYTGNRSKQYSVRIAGYPSDIAFTQMLFASLTMQMTRAMVFSMVDLEDGAATRTWKISFQEGFVARVAHRLKQDAEARNEQRDTPGTDLVLAREQNVRRYLEDELGLSFKPINKSQRRIDYDGYHRGRDAGAKADLDNRAKLGNQRELTQ